MGKTLAFEEKIKLVETNNNTLELLDEFIGVNGKIWCTVICKICGTKHIKRWNDIRIGKKCGFCARNRKLTFEEKIENIKAKNPNIKILEEYINENNKLVMSYICECGNIKISNYKKLRLGYLCSECGRVKCGFNQRLKLDDIKIELDKINPNIIILSEEYVGSNENIKFRCLKDGMEWEASWHNVSRNHGCPLCGGGMKNTINNVKESLRQINPYIEIISNEYIGAHEKLKCKCLKCGNEWEAKWSNLSANNSGCPKCNSSKGENIVTLFLENNNVEYIMQKTFQDLLGVSEKRHLFYDFYLPTHNILIEYDGEFHFKPIIYKSDGDNKLTKSNNRYLKQLEHDRRKDSYALNNKIKLIRIPFTEKKNINEILQKELGIII